MDGPWSEFQRGTVSVKSNSAPAQDGPWAAFQKTAEPRVSMGDAIARGVGQGVTFNFHDELRGAIAAGGGKIGSDTEPAGPHHALIGAYKLLVSGDPEAKRLYDETVASERAASKVSQEDRPYSTLAGQAMGAVAIPVAGMLNAPTLPARIGRGAAVGAGFGGLSGAGEGEGLTDRASRAAVGAGLGAGVGAVAPPLVEGAIQGARALSRPISTALRGAVDPEAEAGRRVIGALQRDVAADPQAATRLTPQEFVANPNAAVMDMGGETTRALARSAANTSPEGRSALNQTINDRFEGQTGRITDWMRGSFHYPDAQAQQTALQQASRQSNNAAYARAYSEGSEGIWSPGLERLAGSKSVSDAMRRAADVAGDESIVGGYGAVNPRISFTPDGRIQFARGPSGIPTYPDLQYWDLVRREISDAAQRAGRGTSESRRLESMASTLNAELDRVVPSYREARNTAAHFFGARDALEAGQNFVTANLENAATRQALSRMSPTERQLFQDGFVSRFMETLERTGDRRNVLNQIAGSPAAREKLNIALGPQRAAELEARVRIEGVMDLARGAVQGNSTTARQLAEIGFAGGAGAVGAHGTYNMDPQQVTYAAVAGALLAGKRGIDTRVANRVAQMLVSNDPNVLQRGINLVARNDRMLNNLRSADQRIARIGGAEVPTGAPVMQAIGAGRAEEN